MAQEHSTRLETAGHQKLLNCGHHKTGLSSRSSLPGHPARVGLHSDGRSPDLRVSALSYLPRSPQWLIPKELAAYSCGGSRGLAQHVTHRVPF